MKIRNLLLPLLTGIVFVALPVRSQCRFFGHSEVSLLPSRFRENMQRDSAWMMSIPTDRLLHSFRTSAGVFAGREGGYMTVKKLGGWESLDCDLRGHITGHLLSALAVLYAQTGSAAVKAKADSLVAGLAEVQWTYGRQGYLSAFGEGLIDRNIAGKSVWAPWYTLHKILRGLLDQYDLCANDTALAVARRMGDWAAAKLLPLDETTRRRMISNEFGGFNEAMYSLYAITHEERHLRVARFFYHNDKVEPLKAGRDDLGTGHANTFIPKLLGEARNYELTGDADSRRAAELLFNTLTRKHAFVTGEVSDREHLFDPATQSHHLSGYDGENCCTFNLLKLARHVYEWNAADAIERERVTAYCERALFNHILGQQDPASSMVCYFTPLMTGAYRLYSTRDSSYWCCVGSGFESHVGYASFVYAHSGNNLYVNQFIPSVLRWDGTRIVQQTDFPASGRVTYRVEGRPRAFTLHLRKPAWATSVRVLVNGRRAGLSVSRRWQPGDVVVVDYGLSLREEATVDNPNRVALLYGPVVLAGRLQEVEHPFSDPTKYNDYYTFDFRVPSGLSGQASISGLKDLKAVGPLLLVTPAGVEVCPFYDAHHCRYVVYWNRK